MQIHIPSAVIDFQPCNPAHKLFILFYSNKYLYTVKLYIWRRLVIKDSAKVNEIKVNMYPNLYKLVYSCLFLFTMYCTCNLCCFCRYCFVLFLSIFLFFFFFFCCSWRFPLFLKTRLGDLLKTRPQRGKKGIAFSHISPLFAVKL